VIRKEYHVVGGGILGLEIAKRIFVKFRSLKKVHIWDHDVVKQGDVGFPSRYIGYSKVDIIRENLLNYVDDYISNNYLEIHNSEVNNDTFNGSTKDVVINCLDEKLKYNINCNLSVSFNGSILTLQDGKLKSLAEYPNKWYTTSNPLIGKCADKIINAINYPMGYIGRQNKSYMITNNYNPKLLLSSNENDIVISSIGNNNKIFYSSKDFKIVMDKLNINFPTEVIVNFKLPLVENFQIRKIYNNNNDDFIKMFDSFASSLFVICFNKYTISDKSKLNHIYVTVYQTQFT